MVNPRDIAGERKKKKKKKKKILTNQRAPTHIITIVSTKEKYGRSTIMTGPRWCVLVCSFGDPKNWKMVYEQEVNEMEVEK